MILRLEEPRTKRWTLEEYERLGKEGYFAGQRVQLIDGEIIEMPPQGHPHSKAVWRCQKAMEAAFGDSRWVRVQMPLALAPNSQPEPDVAVTLDPAEAYNSHPTSAEIVIEVSDSSIDFDRSKLPVYARAGIREYWIVNVVDRQVEVYRLAAGQYGKPIVLTTGTVSPIAAPSCSINVEQLFA